MSFLDIKDPAKRTDLVDEYVKAMKTVRRRNMGNRERKLAIGEELQTLFHPIVNATKQGAEKTAEEPNIPYQHQNHPHTFGIHAAGDGRHAMGNSMAHIEGNILKVDDREYEV